jgi:hypothetical protein
MSTLNVTNIAGPSNTGTAATLSSINGGPISGARNRIINGDMRIDQRNGGAAVAINGNFLFAVDRAISGGVPSAGTFTAQRSTLAPAGFTNSLVCTVGTADASLAAGDYYFPFFQKIEGFNVSDLGWGTAAAQPITVSFWCRSSVTGTFAVALRNATPDRSHVKTFSITAANTWEYKSVVVPGDTSGTWVTDNSAAYQLSIGAIGGSSVQASPDTWVAANAYTTSSCVNWMATSGATFYITGVQLEAGTVATPFERRSYGQELELCYRYCQVMTYNSIYSGSGVGTAFVATKWSTTDAVLINVPLLSTMRAAPSLSKSGGSNRYVNNQVVTTLTLGAMTGTAIGPISMGFTNNTINATIGWVDDIGVVTASAEL